MYVADGTLNGSTSNSSILLAANIPLDTEEQKYKIYIWLDENEEFDIGMENEPLSITVRCEATMKPIEGPLINIASKIRSIYDYSNKSTFTNNEVTYSHSNIFDTDNSSTTSGGLMFDRLGGTTTSIVDGNIRYYGKNPNNYIYFNCSTYPSTNCELWRIIGVFDNKIKIINTNVLENIAWDYDKNTNSDLTTYSNNWEDSSLQQLLNGAYYNGDTSGTITYYSQYQPTYKIEELITEINMQEKGIKNNETRNLISETTWYLGGYGSMSSLYANDMYIKERTYAVASTVYGNNPFTVNLNIGIMYASDYNYASDLSVCKEEVGTYSNDQTNCIETNYLFTGTEQWVINQNPNSSTFVLEINSIGNLNSNGGGGMNSYYNYEVRPVLYLNSNTKITSGTGSLNDPYKLSIN